MALFGSPCNNSLIPRTWPSNYLFPPIYISTLKKVPNTNPQILIKLSQKKPYFPRCSTSSAEPDNSSNTTTIIFLKGLAQSTSEGSLKAIFSQFGDVSRVKILTDKKSKQSLGFAYIWFPDKQSAESAIQEMNGKFLDGRFIQVQIAKPGSCKPRVKTAPYKF